MLIVPVFLYVIQLNEQYKIQKEKKNRTIQATSADAIGFVTACKFIQNQRYLVH